MVSGGLILVDSTLVERRVRRTDVTACYVPAAAMAQEIGAPTLANMILIGRLMRETEAVSPEGLESALEKVISARHRDLLEINQKAIRYGYCTECGSVENKL